MSTNYPHIKAQKRDLTQGDIVGHIVRMAVPMTIGIGSIISYSLADTYFVGLLGADELAAVGYTFPVVTLLFNAIFGMAIAMSAVVSRKVGAGAIDEVRATASLGVTMAVILAFILCCTAFAGHNVIFESLGADEIVRPHIDVYMPYVLIGMVFLSIPIVANSAIRGMGDAFWPAIVMVTVAVVNVILDPILIFGWFGLPAMGVKGAAIATMIANIFAAIMALMVAIFREKLLSLNSFVIKAHWIMVFKSLAVIALPVSLANIITPITTYIYTSFLSPLGHDAVAGFGVVTRLEAFALIPIMAVAGGMAPVIGQNFGAEKMNRVQEALGKAMKFGIVYGVGCAIVMALIAPFIARVFSKDANVHEFIIHGLWIVPISYIGLNVFLVVASSMNAMGRAKRALVLNLLKAFAVMVPLAWLGIYFHEETGFFVSVMASNLIAMVMAVHCLRTLDCFQNMKPISFLMRNSE